jgi:hypothetical protein
MKFSPRIRDFLPSFSWALLLLAMRAASVGSLVHKVDRFDTVIADLELQEFKESSNLEVKEQLARAYWCSGKRGLAIEKWLWLNQFFRNHPRRPQWREHIHTAQRASEKLGTELQCSKP